MLARNGAGEGVPVVSQDLVAFREYEYREVCEATRNFAATEMLGSGKFADVYRGTTPDGVKHAFKRLKERAEEGSRAGELLERELRTLCRLSHPSVVRLHGSCITPSEQVLVYEIVEGGTLEDAIKVRHGERRWEGGTVVGIGKGASNYTPRGPNPSNRCSLYAAALAHSHILTFGLTCALALALTDTERPAFGTASGR